MCERLAIIACLVVTSLVVSAPPGANEWPFDRLQLRNGVSHEGVILEESPGIVRFQIVRRFPGRPTVWFTCIFRINEIEKVTKVTEEERTALKNKLLELDPTAEARRLERMDFKPCDWGNKKGGGIRYDSDYFVLVSDASEEIVRRAAYRLENVYAAYVGFLQPKFKGGNPTLIRIYRSFEGYQSSLPAGFNLKNPAYFDIAANRVSCGTDLHRLGEDLQRFRGEANQLLEEVAKQEAEVRRLYGKKPELNRHLQPILATRSQIRKAASVNEAAFDQATEILFRQLYHEAFHAYVLNFVYPSNLKDSPGELPRWLNEGMAQVFETAIFEAGELRIGHADKVRLEKSKERLAKAEYLSLKELLTGTSKSFVIQPDSKVLREDQAYLTAWGIASYLMLERRLIDTNKTMAYLKAHHSGADPVDAFEKWVGQSLPEFEKGFHDWLKRLKPDGSLSNPS